MKENKGLQQTGGEGKARSIEQLPVTQLLRGKDKVGSRELGEKIRQGLLDSVDCDLHGKECFDKFLRSMSEQYSAVYHNQFALTSSTYDKLNEVYLSLHESPLFTKDHPLHHETFQMFLARVFATEDNSPNNTITLDHDTLIDDLKMIIEHEKMLLSVAMMAAVEHGDPGFQSDSALYYDHLSINDHDLLKEYQLSPEEIQTQQVLLNTMMRRERMAARRSIQEDLPAYLHIEDKRYSEIREHSWFDMFDKALHKEGSYLLFLKDKNTGDKQLSLFHKILVYDQESLYHLYVSVLDKKIVPHFGANNEKYYLSDPEFDEDANSWACLKYENTPVSVEEIISLLYYFDSDIVTGLDGSEIPEYMIEHLKQQCCELLIEYIAIYLSDSNPINDRDDGFEAMFGELFTYNDEALHKNIMDVLRENANVANLVIKDEEDDILLLNWYEGCIRIMVEEYFNYDENKHYLYDIYSFLESFTERDLGLDSDDLQSASSFEEYIEEMNRGGYREDNAFFDVMIVLLDEIFSKLAIPEGGSFPPAEQLIFNDYYSK